MPTYTVKYSNINLSQKQKNSIANDITNTHSKFTGANTFFAQVIFQKNQKNSHFIGGRFGYMFFYGLDQLASNPLSLFFIWEGGLSFYWLFSKQCI